MQVLKDDATKRAFLLLHPLFCSENVRLSGRDLPGPRRHLSTANTPATRRAAFTCSNPGNKKRTALPSSSGSFPLPSSSTSITPLLPAPPPPPPPALAPRKLLGCLGGPSVSMKGMRWRMADVWPSGTSAKKRPTCRHEVAKAGFHGGMSQ